MVVQPAVSDLQGKIDAELAGAVRLRTMLALAQSLLPILQTIMARPTFRYAQRAHESSGLLAGRLDVPRYVQRRSGRSAPKVYPVRVVERDHATVENLLAVSALQAVSRALATVPTNFLPARSSTERRHLALVRGDLRRVEQMPLASGIGRTAASKTRSTTLSQQRLEVLRRINRGDLASPRPYRLLADWVRAFLTGAGIDPGSRAWFFYDERFDTRLLEVWTLGALIKDLVEHYGPADVVEPLWARKHGPIAVWRTPQGRIELFFQRETAGIGLPGRWTITSRDRRLRAIPDLVLCLTSSDDVRAWLLVDCKLRRHEPLPPDSTQGALDLPTEEIYKLLGYFDHLLGDDMAYGALVYYTPGGNGSLSLEADEPPARKGRVALVGVDPAEPEQAVLAISAIGNQVRTMLG
jgi:hypothetical protein